MVIVGANDRHSQPSVLGFAELSSSNSHDADDGDAGGSSRIARRSRRIAARRSRSCIHWRSHYCPPGAAATAPVTATSATAASATAASATATASTGCIATTAAVAAVPLRDRLHRLAAGAALCWLLVFDPTAVIPIRPTIIRPPIPPMSVGPLRAPILFRPESASRRVSSRFPGKASRFSRFASLGFVAAGPAGATARGTAFADGPRALPSEAPFC